MSISALVQHAIAEDLGPEHYPLYLESQAASVPEEHLGLYRHDLAPNLHQRQMRAAYLRVYATAIRMGLAEVAARSHAARVERKLDRDVRSGARPPFSAKGREPAEGVVNDRPSLVLGR